MLEKKVSLKKFLTSFLSLFVIFLLISCDTFLQGSSFQEELETQITIANSPDFTVYFSADNNLCGKLISASVKENCRVKDIFNLEFELAENYRFIGWKAVNKNNKNINYDSYVRYEDQKSTNTKVTIIETNEQIVNSELLFRPVCIPVMGLDLNSCAPRDTSSINPACSDSTITLAFTNNMSAEIIDHLNEIKIYYGTSDYSDYFQTPEFNIENPKLIRILAKTQNLESRIPFSSTTESKELKVVVPGSFKYVTEDGDEEIGKDVTFSYVVNYSTAENATVNFGITAVDDDGVPFSSSDDFGSLRIDGQSGTTFTKTYYIGQTAQILFKVDPDYEFMGWLQNESTKDYIEYLYPRDEFGEYLFTDTQGNPLYYDDNTSTAGLLVKIYNAFANLTVTASVHRIPTYDIKIASSEGKITPNGTSTYKKNEIIPLSFSSDADYCFTNWRVLLDDKDVTDDEYIIITDKDSDETTAYLNKQPAYGRLSIVPVCEIRPTTLFYTPTYSAAGSYRDARIQIMFDHAMSEDSIYYTGNEMNSESADCLMPGGIDGGKVTPLYVDSTDKLTGEAVRKYYGYIDVVTGEQYFKNIKITDHDTGVNLLSCYGTPYFETSDILVIPTKGGEYAPKARSQITVEISKNIFFKTEDSKEIPMYRSLKWSYRVNKDIDTDAPEFTNYESPFILKTVGNDDSSIELSTYGDTIPAGTAWMKDCYSKDRKLYVTTCINDAGSGPSPLLYANIIKVQNSNYVSDVTDASKILYLDVDGQEASVTDGVIDLSTYEDGIYRIDFYTSDTNGNYLYTRDLHEESEPEAYYWIVLDNTAPVILSNPTVATAKKTLNYTWSRPDYDTDFSNVKIYHKLHSEEVWSEPLQPGNTAYTGSISSLRASNKYDVKFVFSDIFGNEREIEVTKNTAPENVLNVTQKSDYVVNASGTTTVYPEWDLPEESSTLAGIRVYLRKDNSSVSPTNYYTSYNLSLSSSGNVLLDTVPTGHSYYYCIAAYDDEGNICPDYDTSLYKKVRPNVVTGLTAKTSEQQIETSWTYGSGDHGKVEVEYSSSSTFASYSITTVGTASNSSVKTYKTPELGYGQTYYFRVRTYTVDGTESVVTSVVRKNTCPGEISSPTIAANSSDVKKPTVTITKPSTVASVNGFSSIRVYYSESSFTKISDQKYVTVTDATLSSKNSLSGTITLPDYGTYYLRYCAVDGEGNVGPIDKLLVQKYISIKPNAVSNIRLGKNDYTNGVLKVYWTRPSDVRTSNDYYKVFWGTTSDCTTGSTGYINAYSNGYVETYTITGLAAGTSYYARVVRYAKNSSGTYVQDVSGGVTSSVSAYTCPPKAYLSGLASSTTDTKVTLSWSFASDPNNRISGVKIYQATSSDFSDQNLIKTISGKETKSCTLDGILGKKNYFKIYTYDSENYWSDISTDWIIFSPAAPSNCYLWDFSGSTEDRIIWTEPTTYYEKIRIYYSTSPITTINATKSNSTLNKLYSSSGSGYFDVAKGNTFVDLSDKAVANRYIWSGSSTLQYIKVVSVVTIGGTDYESPAYYSSSAGGVISSVNRANLLYTEKFNSVSISYQGYSSPNYSYKAMFNMPSKATGLLMIWPDNGGETWWSEITTNSDRSSSLTKSTYLKGKLFQFIPVYPYSSGGNYYGFRGVRALRTCN